MDVAEAAGLGSQHWMMLAPSRAGAEVDWQACQRRQLGAERGTWAGEAQVGVEVLVVAEGRGVLGCQRSGG